jgi:hypothetical protein
MWTRLPAAEILGRDGVNRLALGTCGGAFRDGHYDDTVVYPSRPPEESVPRRVRRSGCARVTRVPAR